jgi:hypothetical protein
MAQRETNGWRCLPFMVGYLSALCDNAPMIKTPPSGRSPASRSKEVETVRLFTTSGHPWIAFAALVVWRLPVPAMTVAAIVAIKHGVF